MDQTVKNEQKGMHFDHNFLIIFPFFFPPKKNRDEENEKEKQKL